MMLNGIVLNIYVNFVRIKMCDINFPNQVHDKSSNLFRSCSIFLHDFIFFKSSLKDIFFTAFRKRGRWREVERERETSILKRNIDWLVLICAPIGDGTHNLSMCPDQESNQWPSSLWDGAPTTWATPARPWILYGLLNIGPGLIF